MIELYAADGPMGITRLLYRAMAVHHRDTRSIHQSLHEGGLVVTLMLQVDLARGLMPRVASGANAGGGSASDHDRHTIGTDMSLSTVSTQLHIFAFVATM